MTAFFGVAFVRRPRSDASAVADDLAAALAIDGAEVVASAGEAHVTYTISGPTGDDWFVIQASPDELLDWTSTAWSAEPAARIGDTVLIVAGGGEGYGAGMWLMTGGQHVGDVSVPMAKLPPPWEATLGTATTARLNDELGDARDLPTLLEAVAIALQIPVELTNLRSGIDRLGSIDHEVHVRKPILSPLTGAPALRPGTGSRPLRGALTATGFLMGRVGSRTFWNEGRAFEGLGVEVAGSAVTDGLLSGWEVWVRDRHEILSWARVPLRPQGPDRMIGHLDHAAVNHGLALNEFGPGMAMPDNAWQSSVNVEIRASVAERAGEGVVKLRVWPHDNPDGVAMDEMPVRIVASARRPIRARADRGDAVAQLNMDETLYGVVHAHRSQESLLALLEMMAEWTARLLDPDESAAIPTYCALQDPTQSLGIRSLRPGQLGRGNKWAKLVDSRAAIASASLRHPGADTARTATAAALEIDADTNRDQDHLAKLELRADRRWGHAGDRDGLLQLLESLFDRALSEGFLVQASVGTALEGPAWLDSMTPPNQSNIIYDPRTVLYDVGEIVWIGPALISGVSTADLSDAVEIAGGVKLRPQRERRDLLEATLEPLVPRPA